MYNLDFLSDIIHVSMICVISCLQNYDKMKPTPSKGSAHPIAKKRQRWRLRNLQRTHLPGFYRTVILPSGHKRTTWVEYSLAPASGPSGAKDSTTSGTGSTAEQHNKPNELHPVTEDGHCSMPTSRPARLPPSHYDRKAKLVAEWASVRTQMLNLASVTELAPNDAHCSMCDEVTTSPIRCADCGPRVMWCVTCAVQDHRMRPFHTLEQWSVSAYY